ncbi:MAG: type II toxin-antitoxin system RatA family toxin [Salinarimonadaceae bacterium]|nr:MAG: type II toxin-antitoxin system RatA family toxin [Salinarimonadaceae bacterium]
MPSFHTVKSVAFSPRQMFDLVADVEKYPEFVPLCESLRVRRRSASGEGVETLVADMSVGYRAIKETFATRVMLDKARLRIDVEYIDGPFRFLENRWRFIEARNGGCDVDFHIAYEFRNRALGMLMGAMFDRAFRMFTNAFEERAKRVYASPEA